MKRNYKGLLDEYSRRYDNAPARARRGQFFTADYDYILLEVEKGPEPEVFYAADIALRLGFMLGYKAAQADARDKEKARREAETAARAKQLLELDKRRREGLTTPKQIDFLENYYGFHHVKEWKLDQARKMIQRIAGNNWKVPLDINPADYVPQSAN